MERSGSFDPKPGYEDLEIVKREVPDGKLCSAADSKKDGLNLVSNDWYRTDVTPTNGTMEVRIIGTAPHVPSFAKVFLTKPGFDPTRSPLTWNDLTLIHEEKLESRKPTGAPGRRSFPPPGSSSSRCRSPEQSGKATLFVQWQRDDPAGRLLQLQRYQHRQGRHSGPLVRSWPIHRCGHEGARAR
jgi:chitin-binding protein